VSIIPAFALVGFSVFFFFGLRWDGEWANEVERKERWRRRGSRFGAVHVSYCTAEGESLRRWPIASASASASVCLVRIQCARRWGGRG
jgi:hypothetical protein